MESPINIFQSAFDCTVPPSLSPSPLPFSWLFVLGGSHGGCKGVAGVGVYGGGMRHSRHSAATPRRHIALLSTPVTLPPLHSSIMNVFIPKRSSFCLFQAKPVLPSLPATNQFVSHFPTNIPYDSSHLSG